MYCYDASYRIVERGQGELFSVLQSDAKILASRYLKMGNRLSFPLLDPAELPPHALPYPLPAHVALLLPLSRSLPHDPPTCSGIVETKNFNFILYSFR